MGEDIIFEIVVDTYGRELKTPLMKLYVLDYSSRYICGFSTYEMVKDDFVIKDRTTVRIIWKSCRLMAGNYSLSLLLLSAFKENIDIVKPESAPSFTIVETDIYNTGRLDGKFKKRGCIIMPDGRWEFEQMDM